MSSVSSVKPDSEITFGRVFVKTEPDELRPWLSDASNLAGGHAERVCLPADSREVSEVLIEATRTATPVTIAGAGTGVTGGRIAFGGGVLAMERMAALHEISGQVARVQAGVRLDQLQAAVAQRGLFYPPDPTEWSCQMGGTVATNASGARTFKYGTTRDYVNALEVVLATGELLRLRRGEFRFDEAGQLSLPLASGRTIDVTLPSYRMPATRKHAAGYYVAPQMDAIDLFIGSEGTLGVITEIELRLLPQPENVLAGIVFFEQENDLLALVAQARAASLATRKVGQVTNRPYIQPNGQIDARALEYFDREALTFLRPHYPRIPDNVAGAIFFEQEICSDTEDELMTAWLALLEKHHARLEDSWFATNDKDRQQLRAFRHHLPVLANEWIARHKQRKVSTDMAVPDAAFAEMLAFYQAELRVAQLAYVIFGHIGDNHLHVNMLPRDDAEAAQARELYARFVQRAVSLGGTVSAEHGIGKIKRPYLAMMYDEKSLAEMAALKRVFDPAGILGRGNLF